MHQKAEEARAKRAEAPELIERAINLITVLFWLQGVTKTRELPHTIRVWATDQGLKLPRFPYDDFPYLKWQDDPGYVKFAASLNAKYRPELVEVPIEDHLQMHAEYLITLGKPLPVWLQKYLLWRVKENRQFVAPSKRKRGRDPYENLIRDTAIATAAKMAISIVGCRLTRSREDRVSACSIVVSALKGLGIHFITEASAAQITSRMPNPGFEELRPLLTPASNLQDAIDQLAWSTMVRKKYIWLEKLVDEKRSGSLLTD
jgi:hypothetical protein